MASFQIGILEGVPLSRFAVLEGSVVVSKIEVL